MTRALCLLLLLLPGLAAAAEDAAECPAGTDATATAAEETKTDAKAETKTPALPPPAYASPLRQQAQKILNGPEFHRREQTRELVLRDWLKRDKKKQTEASAHEPLNLATVAQVAKALLTVALAIALLWLLWRGGQWLSPRAARRSSGRGDRAVQEAQMLAPAGTVLPERISDAARTAWQRGDTVLALSLLYRGAVRGLAEQHRIELPASATEGECLQLAKRSGKAVVNDGFAPIVRAWTALAYARRTPTDFDALLQTYRRCFEPADSAGGAA